MRIIGISPLDKDATVCLVEDGQVVFACGEERLSRKKMHAGFPHLSLAWMMDKCRITPAEVDMVVYAFFEPEVEERLMRQSLAAHRQATATLSNDELFRHFSTLPRWHKRVFSVPGVAEEKLYMHKGQAKEFAYRLLATRPALARWASSHYQRKWLRTAVSEHQGYHRELMEGLATFGLAGKLMRIDHHATHSANAYFTSGFDQALIVTLDGYGSGLAGRVSIGRDGRIDLVHQLLYPNSLGEFYERVTSSLGLKPNRHEGKVVGLAAYEDPKVLRDVVHSLFEVRGGDFVYRLPHNLFFARHLASLYPKPVVAAAFQRVLEEVGCEYIAHYQRQTGLRNLVLSGGVIANVKANQRFYEVPGIERIFIHPNMGDGGCGVGAALLIEARNGLKPYRLKDVYWGPEYSPAEIRSELQKEGLDWEEPADMEHTVAQLLADGNIVARFDGRMEYGPRALGNRSILYHAKDPSVNLWLNQQLQRTEYMPFAPMSIWEERARCFENVSGAEHAAEFMTITFSCTPWFKAHCPAAVHVDGTARPQLVRKEVNPKVHRILTEYQRLTGIPAIINTSFNMHEEPIVCSPYDAIRAFKLGHIPYLAAGPDLVRGKQ
jgi:carbamoyltransferase